ncbi:DoxX family protein [Streptomyces sp. NPDC004610]|uniref:DoxX family protein n=1 Tax=unclassified Streptomyces TaxID=2593676 RepID=UPI0033A82254
MSDFNFDPDAVTAAPSRDLLTPDNAMMLFVDHQPQMFFGAASADRVAVINATVGGVMTVALTVKWPNGLWVQHDGYEYPLILIGIATTLALTGPGRLSADNALGLPHWPAWSASAALAAGLVGGLAARALLHHSPAPATQAPPRSP